MEPLIVRSIVENMPIGLMVIDPAGKIIVSNAALCAILGLAREDLAQKGWGELFIREDMNLEFNQVLIDVILKEVENLQRRVPYEAPDGRVLQLSLTSSYLTVDAQLVGIVLLVEDVTETYLLHQRETQMLSTMHQLQLERSEGLNKLALSVAHQIRNPMATIGGFAHMLLKSKYMDAAAAEPLGIILSELRKLENLVRVVTEYASIPQASAKKVQVKALLEHAVERLSATASARGRKVRVLISCATRVEAAVDLATFPGALDAVMLNALEAAPEGGAPDEGVEICVAVKVTQAMLRISVVDKGVGVAAKDLPFVFDPFYTTKPQAVGMGLCLAKRVALEHHGEITIASEEGQGAEITLRVPQQR
jgi:PAS domain S-box-containing protein